MKFFIEVKRFERMPTGYGVMMHDMARDSVTACPIVLNVLFHFAIEIYFLIQRMPMTWRTWNQSRGIR